MGFVLDRNVVMSRFEEAAGRVLQHGEVPDSLNVREGVVKVAVGILEDMDVGWDVSCSSVGFTVRGLASGLVFVLPKGADELDVAGRIGVVWQDGDEDRVKTRSGECLGVVGSGVALANAVCGVAVEGLGCGDFVGVSPEFSAHLVYEG